MSISAYVSMHTLVKYVYMNKIKINYVRPCRIEARWDYVICSNCLARRRAQEGKVRPTVHKCRNRQIEGKLVDNFSHE